MGAAFPVVLGGIGVKMIERIGDKFIDQTTDFIFGDGKSQQFYPMVNPNCEFQNEIQQLLQDNEQLRAAHNEIAQKYENLEKELKDQCSIEKYDKTKEKIFNEFLKKVTQIDDIPKTSEISIAFLGPNGVGKSSIINKIVGQKVTKVDVVDCTKDIKKIWENDSSELYDVPGCCDERSYTSMLYVLAMKKMHKICVVYNDRIEQVLNLIKLVDACNVELIIIRNKLENETEKSLERIKNIESKIIEDECGKKFPLYLVSAKSGLNIQNLGAQLLDN